MDAKSGNGRVLYSSFDQIEDAVKVAAAIDRYFELTAEEVGYRRDVPVEVWLDPEWDSSTATTFRRFVVFNPSSVKSEFVDWLVDWVIAHELVHWHTEGTPLQRNLPHVTYEGLAERISRQLVPKAQEDGRAQFGMFLDAVRERGDLPHLVSSLSWSRHKWSTSLGGKDRKVNRYALGFTLVDRIGVDALRDAAERGRVTPDAILEMAGVGRDGTGLLDHTEWSWTHYRLNEQARTWATPFHQQYMLDAEGKRIEIPVQEGQELDTNGATWWNVDKSGRVRIWNEERVEIFPKLISR